MLDQLGRHGRLQGCLPQLMEPHRRGGRADRDCLADAGWITGERPGFEDAVMRIMAGMWQFLLAICVSIDLYWFHVFPVFQRLARSAVNTILPVLRMESLPTSPVVLTHAADGMFKVTSRSNSV